MHANRVYPELRRIFAVFAAEIFIVPHNRTTDIFHMRTNLMRPSGQRRSLNQSKLAAHLIQRFIDRCCRLAIRADQTLFATFSNGALISPAGFSDRN